MTEPVILGIETSCDDTAAAVVCGDVVRSSVIATQLEVHDRFGGVVPELASRAHLEAMVPTIRRALLDAGLDPERPAIDAVAATYGPGLVGSLLVGLSAAKALAFGLGVLARRFAKLWRLPSELEPALEGLGVFAIKRRIISAFEPVFDTPRAFAKF